MLGEIGFDRWPDSVAEIGPGDSLGIGLAAMLSGADRYQALDIVKHSDVDRTLAVFDRLVELFAERAPRPTKGWPDFDPYLNGQLFPHHLLTEERLARTLAPERVAAIRDAIVTGGDEKISITYHVPWSDPAVVRPGSVDLAISHSVLEHVDDLPATYAALFAWLRPGGLMSHQIDYTSHGIARHWNGFRDCPEPVWALIRGRNAFYINRSPHSEHTRLMRENGFDVVCDLANKSTEGSLPRQSLSQRWTSISDDDLISKGGFVQARKPG
jgi:hypothetical protein